MSHQLLVHNVLHEPLTTIDAPFELDCTIIRLKRWDIDCCIRRLKKQLQRYSHNLQVQTPRGMCFNNEALRRNIRYLSV